MRLSAEEERMLAGKEGPGIQRAMELLVAVGEAYDAEVMIGVAFAHLLGTGMAHYPMGQFGVWSRELEEESVEGAKQFKVPTTINPTFLDLRLAERLGYPQPYFDEVKASMAHGEKLYGRLGVIPAFTCSPSLIHPLRKGEHIGAAESSVVQFYNTVFGAMGNRESGPTALASALTGRTPFHGMHLPENRYGQILVELEKGIDPREFTNSDYSAFSYYVGGLVVDKIPVFAGLPSNMTMLQLKYLCISLAVSGGLPMIHVLGVTPESPTLEAAFGGRKPVSRITVTRKNIADTYKELCAAKGDKVQLVVFGCPHASLPEIQDIARLLQGKRIHKDVTLIVCASRPLVFLAKEMGLVDIIEKAGGLVVPDMCTACPFLRRQVPKGFKVEPVATDSTKSAHYLKYAGVPTWFGSTQKCVDAAIAGKWEAD
ncbi:MAG: aconitase X catalytic domain-containing protein [Chloroflexi bacterium]|nr:aconitase X catalytic domain-containing protein [Chloroflexota bacterium]